MTFDPIILSLVTIGITGGAAFGGVKAGLNGARLNIKQIHESLAAHIAKEDEAAVDERLARLETKIDMLIK